MKFTGSHVNYIRLGLGLGLDSDFVIRIAFFGTASFGIVKSNPHEHMYTPR